jgi:hypothetical protein
LRREFDRKPHKIKQILKDEQIRKAFLGGAPNDDKKVVKAFIGLTSNASTALKRHPKVSPNSLGPHAFTWCSSIPVLRLWPSIAERQMPAINGLEGLTRSYLDGSVEVRYSRSFSHCATVEAPLALSDLDFYTTFDE